MILLRKKKLMVSGELSVLDNKHYKLTTALDVLEHIFDEDINPILSTLNTEILLVRIPVKLDGEEDFHLEVSRKDLSHVNCKTREEWIQLINSHGFDFKDTINSKTVYDSPGVFCGYFIKNK